MYAVFKFKYSILWSLLCAAAFQEPGSPEHDSEGPRAEPAPLVAQNELRSVLRAKLRRTRRSGRDVLKRAKHARGKRGREVRKGKPAAKAKAKAKATAKAKAKAKEAICDDLKTDDALSAKPKAKAKAKAKAKPGGPKAKAAPKAKNGKSKPGSEPLKPDRNYTGYSEDGSLILGCATCRWALPGRWTCLRPCFRGIRWNHVACGEGSG